MKAVRTEIVEPQTKVKKDGPICAIIDDDGVMVCKVNTDANGKPFSLEFTGRPLPVNNLGTIQGLVK